MTISRLASLRPAGAASLLLAVATVVTACSIPDSLETIAATSSSAVSSPRATPAPTASPTPTPAPTPRFTNEPDGELAALIPTAAAGAEIVVAPFDEFGLTPGDIGAAFGEIGDRFASLAVAYVVQPRLTLYAMRVDGEPVETEALEPHLDTAGRYVGIAGLDREPWQLAEAGGHQVWVRPEDNATAAGTMVYTWSSGQFVFLLIGVDDGVNRAVVEQLPGEPAPSPAASPSEEPSGSSVAGPSASPGG